MFKFKHPVTKVYHPIEVNGSDQLIKDAIDATLDLLDLEPIDWDHRTLYVQSVIGSDASTLDQNRISIYYKCSSVLDKCLITRRSTEQVSHKIKQEMLNSPDTQDRELQTNVDHRSMNDEMTNPDLPQTPIPMLEGDVESQGSSVLVPEVKSSSSQAPSTPLQHYHHHQVDSNNFRIKGNNVNAANTTGSGSIVGHNVSNNKMQSIERSDNGSTDTIVPALSSMKNAKTSDGRRILEPVIDRTEEITTAMKKYKEAYLRDFDTNLNASDFARNLSHRMVSVVHLVDIAYINTTIDDPGTYGEEDLKSWDPDELGIASAFIVSPTLLLTNWHVFPTIFFAKFNQARVVFDYDQANSKDKKAVLQPEIFYWADPKLDYCLVAFAALKDDIVVRKPIVMSIADVNHVLKKDNRLTIIQHPEGRPKSLSIDGCVVTGMSRDSGTIVYTNDTSGGSSGSPVFTRTWILVGLHHGAIKNISKKRRSDGRTVETHQSLNQATLISTIYHALLLHLKDMKSDAQTDPSVKSQIKLLQDLLIQDPKMTSKMKTDIMA